MSEGRQLWVAFKGAAQIGLQAEVVSTHDSPFTILGQNSPSRAHHSPAGFSAINSQHAAEVVCVQYFEGSSKATVRLAGAADRPWQMPAVASRTLRYHST